MIVKVVIKGERAHVSGPPGSGVAFEESAARLRSRFAEREERAELVGFFTAESSTLGESKDPAIKARTAEIFEIKERVGEPKAPW